MVHNWVGSHVIALSPVCLVPRVELLGSEDRDATDVWRKPLSGDSEARYRAGEQRSQGTIHYLV